MREASAKTVCSDQMPGVLLKKTFCTEQPVVLPLPYQQGSIDERGKIDIFWKSLISLYLLSLLGMHLPQVCLLSLVMKLRRLLSMKTEVSEYVLVQTAEAQSNVLPGFKSTFMCERAVMVASMQFLTEGRLKPWVLDEDFKRAHSFGWNGKCSFSLT